MFDCVDLFSGFGGWSAGATNAGCNVLWAANHWQEAVIWHKANHPNTVHQCQDLQQANFNLMPEHDLLLASPCCQGHSKARGKHNGNPQYDNSRATAWAVVSALECHRQTKVAIIENVPEFLEWSLFPAWEMALNKCGFQVSPHIVDCADLGVPQNRVRLFIVCTRSKHPLKLVLPRFDHNSALSFIDINSGRWSPVNKPKRASKTLERIANGRKQFGDLFVFSYYGNTLSGRDIQRPIGTITTRDRWAVVKGDMMRMLTADENLRAMSFPDSILRPKSNKLIVHLAGNAVPPMAATEVIQALYRAV